MNAEDTADMDWYQTITSQAFSHRAISWHQLSSGQSADHKRPCISSVSDLLLAAMLTLNSSDHRWCLTLQRHWYMPSSAVVLTTVTVMACWRSSKPYRMQLFKWSTSPYMTCRDSLQEFRGRRTAKLLALSVVFVLGTDSDLVPADCRCHLPAMVEIAKQSSAKYIGAKSCRDLWTTRTAAFCTAWSFFSKPSLLQ